MMWRMMRARVACAALWLVALGGVSNVALAQEELSWHEERLLAGGGAVVLPKGFPWKKVYSGPATCRAFLDVPTTWGRYEYERCVRRGGVGKPNVAADKVPVPIEPTPAPQASARSPVPWSAVGGTLPLFAGWYYRR